MRKILLPVLYLLMFFAFSCSPHVEMKDHSLNGLWNASIELGGEILPFKFEVLEVNANPVLYLINASERIRVENLQMDGDSVHIEMHIFNTAIDAVLLGDELVGRWTKRDYDDYVLPFKASRVKQFALPSGIEVAEVDLSGKWAVAFDGEEEGVKEPAIGVFVQHENKLTGTFLTPTGDYRYLSGFVSGKSLQLSCFDGEHAFLFKGQVEGDSIKNGHFWSGKTWHQMWDALKDSTVTLPDAESLTYLKEGYDHLSFRFPNLQGKDVSLDDERFKNKVVIVQLMGSWCPNCMDETAFLAPYYASNKDRGLEVVALAFERNPAFDKAKIRLEKLKKRFDISYEMLIAGNNSKEEAAEKLPMLNNVMSFPTTIFIDRTGKVRKIHTGFSGPGTGIYYEHFVEDFRLFMEKLLEEEVVE